MDDRSNEVGIGDRLERALRWAAWCHRNDTRKGTDIPYIQHPVAVALTLDRLGYSEEVVIAGLLHDVVEDTDATIEEVRERFGPIVAEFVEACTEVKQDAQGRKRPWIDRKRDHLVAMRDAPPAARAVMLADKLHNLRSIRLDLEDGRPVWDAFNAPRDQVLWYQRSALDALADPSDPRSEQLARECRSLLEALASDGVETNPK